MLDNHDLAHDLASRLSKIKCKQKKKKKNKLDLGTVPVDVAPEQQANVPPANNYRIAEELARRRALKFK